MAAGGTEARLRVAVIIGAHGVRGLVRLKPLTEAPEDVLAYGPLTDRAGARRFEVELRSLQKGHWLAAIAGVGDRDGADALRGTGLYIDRAALPPPEDADEFYAVDLVGLTALDEAGAPLGQVKAVLDHGAGDLIEVTGPRGASLVVPFTREAVPTVDLAAGTLVIVPPPGISLSGAGTEERRRRPGRGGGARTRGRGGG